jgi:hypothetical protein
MHQMDASSLERRTGFAASDHMDDFKLQALSLIESCGLRHPDREEGIGRSRLADPEGHELRGSSRRARTEQVERDHNANRMRNADECMSLHCSDLSGDPE